MFIVCRGVGLDQTSQEVKHRRWSEQSRICMIEMPLSFLLEFETRPVVWVFISVCMLTTVE